MCACKKYHKCSEIQCRAAPGSDDTVPKFMSAGSAVRLDYTTNDQILPTPAPLPPLRLTLSRCLLHIKIYIVSVS